MIPRYKRIKETVGEGEPRWQELADKLAVSIAHYERRGCANLAADCREAREKILAKLEMGWPAGATPPKEGEGGKEV